MLSFWIEDIFANWVVDRLGVVLGAWGMEEAMMIE